MEDSFFEMVRRAEYYGNRVKELLSQIPNKVPAGFPATDTVQRHRDFFFKHNLSPCAKEAWHYAEKATVLANLYF